MKINRIVLASLLMSCLVACQPAGDAKGKPGKVIKPGPPALDAITLEKRPSGLFCVVGTDQPFTGTDVEPDTKKAIDENRLGFVLVTPYKDGRIHGTAKTYYPKGELQEERIYVDGAAKTSTIYHANGQKKTFVAINAKGVAEGSYMRWYPDGKVHTEATFDENEKFHGVFHKFDEAGTLVADYTMNHGVIAEIRHESAAQREERIKKSGPAVPVP